MTKSSRLKTLVWFLQRPSLYPQMLHMATRKLSPSYKTQNETGAAAAAWCEQRAIEPAAAIEQITGVPAGPSIDRVFPEVFAEAAVRAKRSPIDMGGPGDLLLLYRVAEHLKAVAAIETGVAFGWSSLAMLLSLSTRPGARLVSTDMPIPREGSDMHVGCVVPSSLSNGWSIVKNADRQALPQAVQTLSTIDMCHYDSDKSYEGRMWAYPLLWRTLRPGGIFISDDINDNFAFRDFAASIGQTPIVIRVRETASTKYVGVLTKAATRT